MCRWCRSALPSTTALAGRWIWPDDTPVRLLILAPARVVSHGNVGPRQCCDHACSVAVPHRLDSQPGHRWRNDVKLWSHVPENTAPHAAVRGEIMRISDGLASLGTPGRQLLCSEKSLGSLSLIATRPKLAMMRMRRVRPVRRVPKMTRRDQNCFTLPFSRILQRRTRTMRLATRYSISVAEKVLFTTTN